MNWKGCQIEVVRTHLQGGGPRSHQTDERIGVEVEAIGRRGDRGLVVLRHRVDRDATDLGRIRFECVNVEIDRALGRVDVASPIRRELLDIAADSLAARQHEREQLQIL